MAIGQVGIVSFDAERLQRPHVVRERPRAYDKSGSEMLVEEIS
jgi:hypothetical protein